MERRMKINEKSKSKIRSNNLNLLNNNETKNDMKKNVENVVNVVKEKINVFNFDDFNENDNKLVDVGNNIKVNIKYLKNDEYKKLINLYFKDIDKDFNNIKLYNKDSSILKVEVIDYSINLETNELTYILSNGNIEKYNMLKEKKFLEILDIKDWKKFVLDLKNNINNKNYIYELINPFKISYIIYINNKRLSLFDNHIYLFKEILLDELNNKREPQIYIGKIFDKNNGGFFVNINGLVGFLPGALAAPNKILNFDEYLGKSVYVMIENYLKESDTFIFSHKKYVNYILKYKIDNLKIDNTVLSGTVTGTSKAGIFIEFNEIFTGLLHPTMMLEELYNDYINDYYKPGTKIEFKIYDIIESDNTKKIILCDKNIDVLEYKNKDNDNNKNEDDNLNENSNEIKNTNKENKFDKKIENNDNINDENKKYNENIKSIKNDFNKSLEKQIYELKYIKKIYNGILVLFNERLLGCITNEELLKFNINKDVLSDENFKNIKFYGKVCNVSKFKNKIFYFFELEKLIK